MLNSTRTYLEFSMIAGHINVGDIFLDYDLNKAESE